MKNIKKHERLVHPDFWIKVLPYKNTTVWNGEEHISVSGFYVILQRKSDAYLWLYFGPCFLMVVTSWISFAVSFEVVPGRLGLLLTLLLMMINMSNSISLSIPKSDGMCPLIAWIYISMIFNIFAIFEYFIILIKVKFGENKCQVKAKKMRSEKVKNVKDWATGLDKTSLVIFPLAYLMSVIIFILAHFL